VCRYRIDHCYHSYSEEEVTSLEFDGSIKMLKETLCDAQALAVFLQLNASIPHYVDTLQKLINECDRHRPIGPDGKHGDRHTETCGCEDKGVHR
jgi:hypothetical protein